MLGRAFHEDPVIRWLQPDPERRTAALPGLFGALARHHFLPGRGVEVAVTDEEHGGVALWDPPGRWQQSSRESIAMLPAVLRAVRGRLAVSRVLTDLMKENHPEESHWYLAVLGSDPKVRGGGFGHALMRSRLDRCDAEYAPAYLESSSPDNVPYYERFGFEVTGEIVIPDGGPTLWPMWRRPR